MVFFRLAWSESSLSQTCQASSISTDNKCQITSICTVQEIVLASIYLSSYDEHFAGIVQGFTPRAQNALNIKLREHTVLRASRVLR